MLELHKKNNFIDRDIIFQLYNYLSIFPVVAILGPRQSGKSTLLKEYLKDNYQYITFDDSKYKEFFLNDPQGFMRKYNDKIIFDEVQKVPQVFDHLKLLVDQ
ncbi:MAG: AAA family ATPase, partial [Candidatus Margulisiibacteriota bacterium]